MSLDAHSSRAHARLSPSGAHRWANCPGSVRLSEGIPNTSSIFADEGTAAHTLAEHCLASSTPAVDCLGGHVDVNTGRVSKNPGEGNRIFTIGEEMVDAVQVYCDTVNSLIEDGDEVEFEAKLDLRHIPGMEFGTGDCVIYKPATRRLIIADFKYGRGVPVEAEDNPQTRAYALGASQRFHNRGVEWVESVIVQPRCPHPAGSVRREGIDALTLVEFRMELESLALRTVEPDAELNPGEWCKFCPAAPTCPALRGKVLSVAQMEFSEEPPVVDEMSLDEMAAVMRHVGIVKDWIKRVEERAHRLATDGTPPTGFKLVWSRATRKWRDEDEAKAHLAAVLDLSEDDIYVEPKMRSPAQIEKVLGSKRKGEIKPLVVSRSSGTILVSADDPRPAVKADAEDEFA